MSLIIILIIAILLTIAAIISAAETAITGASPGIIQKLKSDGNQNAGLLLDILKIKDKVISSLLVGNSIANTLCTTIATGLFIEFLGEDIGTIAAAIVMSFTIIVFSEVIPKAIAVVKAEKIALIATPALLRLLKLLDPINNSLSYIVKFFCIIFRIDLNQTISATDEVRGVIEHHMYEGNVYRDDRDMLGGVLDIRKILLSDIMVHRSKVLTININAPTDNIIQTILTSTHTRIPFWEHNHDNIIGVMHVKDLINAIYNIKKFNNNINIKALLTTPVFVPDTSLAMQQLKMFREGQTHLACVVDEYGDLQGIVTLEDILEEIVGQIYDEHDQSKNRITKISDCEYVIDGTMPIRDLNRELKWQIDESDATTIAGFVIQKMERIPEQGEYYLDNHLKMIVQKKSDNKINSIKIQVQQNEKDITIRRIAE